VRELLAANFDGWVAAIKGCLDAAADRLPAKTDTQALAQFVLTVMEGGVMQSRTHRTLQAFDASVAGLRSLQLCSERATTGARTILDRIKPQKKPRLATDPSQLMYDLYNDRCDAVVYDADILGAERAAAPERYGPFAGRLITRERYGIAFPKGSPLRASVNAALGTLTRNGTLVRLQKRWLSTDVSKLPVLR